MVRRPPPPGRQTGDYTAENRAEESGADGLESHDGTLRLDLESSIPRRGHWLNRKDGYRFDFIALYGESLPSAKPEWLSAFAFRA